MENPLTAEQFLKNNLIIIKGNRKKDMTEYETLAVQKNCMWNSTIASIAKSFGVTVIDLRKQED